MAIRIEHSLLINRPVEEVFAYSSDPLKQTEWQDGLVRVKADSPMAIGSVTTEVRKVMGRELETQMECVEFDPPKKFSSKSLSGPVEMTFTQSLQSLDEGTQIDILVEGATLITMDDQRKIIDNGSIAIDNGIIIEIGSKEEIKRNDFLFKPSDLSVNRRPTK